MSRVGLLPICCLIIACADARGSGVVDTGPAADALSDADEDADHDSSDTVEVESDGDLGDAEETSEIVDVRDEPLSVPFVPGSVTTPLTDAPFLQEWNHTTPEVDPRIGPLVDVVIAPEPFVGWSVPVQVTSVDVVRSVNAEGVDRVAVVPVDASPLLGAAVFPSALVLASSDTVYRVSATGVVVHEPSPGPVIHGVVQGRSGAWLLTDTGASFVGAEGTTWDEDGPRVLALAEDEDGVVVAGEGVLARWADGTAIGEGSPVWEIVNALDPEYEAVVLDVRLPEPLDVVVFHRDGAYGVREGDGSAELVEVALFSPNRVPLRGAVEAVRTGDGGFLAVGPEGAWRVMDRGDGPEWRVYPAERWLPNEDVRGVATVAEDELSAVYFATAGGLAWVTAEYMTLEEKMDYFAERIVQRHDRDGAVADSRLSVPGDLSTSIPWDSDNDGGWTCYWILSECSRWLETGAEDARANFDRSLERMLSLRTLTGTEHFLARAVIRREGCRLDDCDDPDDGEWFLSPDEAWWVKGDTSNDEVVSHMFMMGPAYDWCANNEQREGIREHVAGIVGGLIDNDWQLIDVDGEVTRYGQFQPAYVNGVGLISDGGRRAVAALGMTALAHHVTGEQRFLDARRELIDAHGYDERALTEAEQPLRWGQYSGDNNELAMQAWMALVRYETDPELRDIWFDGWSRTYAGIVEQEGAMWDVANHMLGGGEIALANIVRWLRLAPMDFVRWDISNDHRRDLIPPPENYEQTGRMRSDGRPLPYDERRLERWNTDQYHVDGGMAGLREMDGADVTAPFWLARRYGLLVPSR